MPIKLIRALTAALVGVAVGVAAGVVSVVAVAASPASAAWTAVRTLSPPNWSGQDQPTVAVDRQGDALLVWAGCDGSAGYCTDRVQVQRRTRAGALGPVRLVTPAGMSATWPKVAVDDDGDGALVWVHDSVISAARVSAAGVPGPVQPVTTWSSTSPSIAVDRSGSALITWTESVRSVDVAKARRFGVDGTLGPELTLGPGGAGGPVAAFADDGTALVVWTEGYERILSVRIAPDGTVSAPTEVAAPATEVRYGQPDLAVEGDGDAVLSYSVAPYEGYARRVVQRYHRNGTLEPAVVATPETHWLSYYSSIVVDRNGTATLVWGRWNWETDNSREVYLRRFPATGTPGPVTVLGRGDWPSVTLDDSGAGFVAWQYPGPMVQESQVHGVSLAANGTPGAVQTVAPDGRSVTAAASPTGAVTVIWQKGTHPSAIQARFTR
ncbi:hypothetical protein [Virgisporangium ochraceum]|uniref:Uncharacterized protein n=1 Tax=Virgisporangium ochraceum TaxID=65505 RepID=A0A8J4EAS9_9ACTN|nr:hypothetical protein [Virgisporangium ochraceum]GIJ68006.1 hypothetical protein Voc01_029230 [Virgisporangium ochraceum]